MSDSDSDSDLYKVSLGTTKLEDLEKFENRLLLEQCNSLPGRKKTHKDKLNALCQKTPVTINASDEEDCLDVVLGYLPAYPSSPPPPPPPSNALGTSLGCTRSRRRTLPRPAGSKNKEVKIASIDVSVLDESEDSIICVEDEGRDMMVKVHSRSGIQRFNINTKQPLSHIYACMARHEGVPVSSIQLYLADQRLKPTDSPVSSALDFSEIIECYLFESRNGPDMIEILLQSESHRGKKLPFKINKYESMSTLMSKYAAQQHIPISQLSFMFDGDVIDKSTTPNEIDMEDGDCVDVVRKK